MRRRFTPMGAPILGVLTASLSCGDPASAPAQGAASLQWAPSTLNAKTPQCVPGPHWSNAPATSSGQPQTSATNTSGGFVVNGEHGALVTCRVIMQGEGYVVSGEIQSMSPNGTFWTDVGFSVTIDSANDAQGSLYITDQQSQVAFSSDTAIVPPKPGCTFSAYEAGSQLGVAPGRAWLSVQCPHINDNRNRAAQECEIESGFLVVQNCLRE
jgi:hypothetical protein